MRDVRRRWAAARCRAPVSEPKRPVADRPGRVGALRAVELRGERSRADERQAARGRHIAWHRGMDRRGEPVGGHCRQDDRGSWCLREIEVVAQIAELRRVLPHRRSPIGPAVGRGVETTTAEEAVLDEAQVRIERVRRVVDEALLRVSTDDQRRDPDPDRVAVDRRRCEMVVEAAPVVPRDEDCRRVPCGALHDLVDEEGGVRLAIVHARRRMLADRLRGDDPRDRRHCVGVDRGDEVVDRLNVRLLTGVLHGVELRQRVPDRWCLGVLRHGHALHRVGVGAVGLGAGEDVVPPRDVVLRHQVGDVGPRVGGLGVVGRARDSRQLVATTQRVTANCARRRPCRHHVEVLGKAPRERGREHVIVQDELVRVGPIVRDVGTQLVAEKVGRRRAVVPARLDELLVTADLPCAHETIHLAVVHREGRRVDRVRPSVVDGVGIVIQQRAAPGVGIGDARIW